MSTYQNETLIRIKAYLKKNKITYRELSARCFISESKLKKMFAGKQSVKARDIETIAHALNIDYMTILFVDKSRKKRELIKRVLKLNEKQVEILLPLVDELIVKGA